MKSSLQSQSLVDVLRSAIESWRRGAGQSRETVALNVTEAHVRIGADVSTGITFDSSSKDVYTQAKHAAQKLYRWLGGDDEQEAKLPANMVPTLLAALPMEQRLDVLNQILCPLGIEARSAEQGVAAGLDTSKHLRAVMKESSEAQLALVSLPTGATEADLLAAHRELIESAQASELAANAVMAEITARQALARAGANQST